MPHIELSSQEIEKQTDAISLALADDPDVQAYLNASTEVKYIILNELLCDDLDSEIKYKPKKGLHVTNFDLNDVTDNHFLIFSALKKAIRDKGKRNDLNLFKYGSFNDDNLIFSLEDLDESDFQVLNHFFCMKYCLNTKNLPYYSDNELQKLPISTVKDLEKLSNAKGIKEISFTVDQKYEYVSFPDNLTGFEDVTRVKFKNISEFPMFLANLKNLKELVIENDIEYPKEFKVNGEISGFENLINLAIMDSNISLEDALKFSNLPKLDYSIFSSVAFPDEETQRTILSAFKSVSFAKTNHGFIGLNL